MCCTAVVVAGSCKNRSDLTETVKVQSAKDQVLLTGAFERVSKEVVGKVRLEKHDERYELVVNPISIPDLGPVHVYLVGLEKVPSTAALDAVDAKYDFGPLEQTGSNEFVAEQHITLPSKPAPELRAVALVNPRFGVVLASATLR